MPPVLTVLGSIPASARGASAVLEPSPGAGRVAPGGVGHQAFEVEAGEAVDEPGEGQGFLGVLDPAALAAGVALDQDGKLQAGLRHGQAQALGDEVVVERDGQAGAAGQRDQAGELGAAQQIEGQEDVVQGGIGHDLGLAQLLAGDADRTQLDLAAGELRQLVCLDVGTELQPVRVGIILRAAEVGLDPVEVDEHGRGVEVVDHPGHGGAPLRRVMVAPPSGGGKPDRRLRRGASHGYFACDGVLRD